MQRELFPQQRTWRPAIATISADEEWSERPFVLAIGHEGTNPGQVWTIRLNETELRQLLTAAEDARVDLDDWLAEYERQGDALRRSDEQDYRLAKGF